MDTRLYVITHKEYMNPDDKEYDGLYIPLHVGRAISEDLGYPGDNAGDNISDRNRSWCELTGIYWLWKNISCDIIGICHYRRYFVVDEDFIRREKIEDILSDHDVIVGNSNNTEFGSLREHYSEMHYWKDMSVCRDVLLEKYPEYENAFELSMDANLFTIGNMMICSKQIYDEYCEWLFDILFETEKRLDTEGYDPFQARVMGYLSERLLRIWLLYNSYKVYEVEVRMMDPADKDNSVKEIELKQKYVDLTFRNLLDQYRIGNYVDLVDSPPIWKPETDKIPVWVCWWQGEEDMPDLVRMCIRSLKKNLPADRCELRFISFENVASYVSFPQWIVDKYNEGKIILTILSDILRMGLLYRYGGMWVDATYYVAKPVDPAMFDNGFYTQRLRRGKWKADVVQGRWACNLLYTQPGAALPRFVLNAYYMYWFEHEELIDYFLLDYLIDAAYSNIEEVRNMIDSCEYSQPDTLELTGIINEPYSAEILSRLSADTTFFKLSNKIPVTKETITGEQTFFGYLFGLDAPE